MGEGSSPCSQAIGSKVDVVGNREMEGARQLELPCPGVQGWHTSFHSYFIGTNESLSLNLSVRKLEIYRSTWIYGEHNGFCHTVPHFLGKLYQYLCSWMEKKKIYCGVAIRSMQPACTGLSKYTWYFLVFVKLSSRYLKHRHGMNFFFYYCC